MRATDAQKSVASPGAATKPKRAATAAPPKSQHQSAILVLGSHRSGTSALTRTLSLLGATLPVNLTSPQPDNMFGYWEPVEVMQVNADILSTMKSEWYDIRPIDEPWFASDIANQWNDRLCGTLKREYGKAPLWVIKEPRLNTLLPVTLRALRDLKVTPLAVFAVRNPIEVARSLAKRDGFTLSYGVMLWMRNMLDAELHTRGVPRSFVTYNGLLEDREANLERVGGELGLAWPVSMAKARQSIDEFLRSEARHHHFTGNISEGPEMPPGLDELYQALLRAAGGDSTGLSEVFDRVRERFDPWIRTLVPFLYAIRTDSGALGKTGPGDGPMKSIEQDFADRIAEAQAAVSSLRANILRAQVEGPLHDRIAHAEGRAEQLRDLLSVKQAEAEGLNRQCGKLERELADVAAEAERLRVRTGEAEGENRQLWTRTDKAESENRQLWTRTDKAESENRQLWKRVDNAEGQLNQAHARVKDAETENQVLWARVDHAELEVQNLQGEERLREEHAKLQAEKGAQLALRLDEARRRVIEIEKRLGLYEGAVPRLIQASRLAQALPAWRYNLAKNLKAKDDKTVWRDCAVIAASGMFDPTYYIGTNPDLLGVKIDPLLHYVVFGGKEGRNPSAKFNTSWYLQNNPDLAQWKGNPLVHYIRHGRKEGRSPLPNTGTPGSVVAMPAAPTSRRFYSDLDFVLKFPESKLAPPDRTPDPKALDIHWVIPDFVAGMGGHMTIFRIAHLLGQFGHKQVMWIQNPTHASEGEAMATMVRHFQPAAVDIRFMPEDVSHITGDAIIASDRWTVFPVAAMSRFFRRFYFVQDHETQFYPAGSHALLTEYTYSLGFDCLCAGEWLHRLMSERNQWATKWDLATDRGVYHPPDNEIRRETNRIAFYSRVTTPRRAVELGMLALEELARWGYDFHVDFFGADMGPFDLPYRHSYHGVASSATLGELYRQASLGVVFSATNHSLLPREMMACRLPVVELDVDSVRSVFPEGTLARAAPLPTAIAEQMAELLDDPVRRARLAENAYEWQQQFSWETSARTIEAGIAERVLLAHSGKLNGDRQFNPPSYTRRPIRIAQAV
jgi:glycosyltransferase involved in cell wall biosynthesis